jgi:carboxyl-terminal processing protease
MSLGVRATLVVVIGTVLGLTVSFAGRLVDRDAHAAHARTLAADADPAAVLADVIARVQSEYVDRLDRNTLIDSAIRGIMQELDAHSRFLDTTAYEDIQITSSGHYAGVGLDVSLQDGQPTVVAPIEDTPAERAGILAGDVVVAVDGHEVTPDNYENMVGRMRGIPGTPVTIDVRRAAADMPLRFELERAEIEVRTVRSEYLGNGFGYVRLTGFSDNTAAGLDRAAETLNEQAGSHLRGLVLDLRSNPGGVLNAAVEVSDRFLETGLIVRGTGRIPHARFEHVAHPGDALEHVPLVVLVNAGSASASEIVAGALKDHQRARIVGERTYGKGSVQTVMPLTEGRALKITTSRYILPSGRTLSGIGIEPDLVVRNADPARQFLGTSGGVPLAEDQQLLQALHVVGFDPLAVSQAQ